jgi:hypothetical protein
MRKCLILFPKIFQIAIIGLWTLKTRFVNKRQKVIRRHFFTFYVLNSHIIDISGNGNREIRMEKP